MTTALPLDEPTLDALRTLAERVALAGGRQAREMQSQLSNIRLKGDRSEVSEADEAVQRDIVATIQAERPDDSFIVEETLTADPAPRPPADDRVCWVIDPIDGTRNFVRSMGSYTCCVGAMFNGVPVVGAVHDPQQQRLYSARAGGPLLIDGQPQAPAAWQQEGARPKGRFVVAVPSTTTAEVHGLVHAWMDEFIVRNLGSTALHLALVSTGQFDAAVSANSKLWDLVPGWMLVTAAGGRIAAPDGGRLFPRSVVDFRAADIATIAVAADATRTPGVVWPV